MKVVWSESFRAVYAEDAAAAPGRMEAVVQELEGWADWVTPKPSNDVQLLRCHTTRHIEWVRAAGAEPIARLAAGAAITAAHLGREEPVFALVRPPGHHASQDHAWGFCYFNNVAVALADLRANGRVQRALVIDFDLHVGDGTENILGGEEWVRIVNPKSPTRDGYLKEVYDALWGFDGDCIAVSAGFDNHAADWGGLLTTEDYRLLGLDVGTRANILGAGCFAVLEGGYNHGILGENVRAFCHGLEQGWSRAAGGRHSGEWRPEGGGAAW